jgi:hypothetical protein
MRIRLASDRSDAKPLMDDGAREVMLILSMSVLVSIARPPDGLSIGDDPVTVIALRLDCSPFNIAIWFAEAT